jgi:hypothetical protein
MEWKLADAKNKLSELVALATTQGPQTIRERDAAVVVVAEKTYLALTGERPDFNDWLLKGPSIHDLELPDRSQSTMRPVEL